jgi:hypothetical protein
MRCMRLSSSSVTELVWAHFSVMHRWSRHNYACDRLLEGPTLWPETILGCHLTWFSCTRLSYILCRVAWDTLIAWVWSYICARQRKARRNEDGGQADAITCLGWGLVVLLEHQNCRSGWKHLVWLSLFIPNNGGVLALVQLWRYCILLSPTVGGENTWSTLVCCCLLEGVDFLEHSRSPVLWWQCCCSLMCALDLDFWF